MIVEHFHLRKCSFFKQNGMYFFEETCRIEDDRYARTYIRITERENGNEILQRGTF